MGFFGCDALGEVADVCTEVEVGLALLEGCPLAEHEVDGGTGYADSRQARSVSAGRGGRVARFVYDCCLISNDITFIS